MIKNNIILIFLLFILVLPVKGNVVTCETAHAKGNPFVVYYYSSMCGTCKEFNPIFNKTESNLKQYNFVKINVRDMHAHRLCYVSSLQYVPSVYIYYPKSKKMGKVSYQYYFNQKQFEYALSTYLSKPDAE